MLRTHTQLIISANTGTRYFAAVAVLNTYVVHDLNNLDAYSLRTVHKQDSMVVRHNRINYMHAILACCTVHSIIRAYTACMLLTSILQNFSSDSHASVKFKLSCTVSSGFIS